ncbi:MAG: class I SAM-dependent methyltransferase [Pseudomonadota bacterium]
MPIDSKSFAATAHGRVHRCNACGFEYVSPRPTPGQAKAFYEIDAYYTQGKSHMVEVENPSFFSRLRTHLAWRADAGENLIDVIAEEIPRGGLVVDIGCGGGQLIRILAERGIRGVGVERDVQAMSLRDSQISVLEGSAESLPRELKPGGCDGVVFSHVLEHLVDPRNALVNAVQLLRSGGLMFCEVPNNESLIARQSGLSWEHLDIPRHINFFALDTLVKLAEAVGLRIRRSYFSGYCRYFSDGYVATEQLIHDRLPAGSHPSIRNSAARSWKMLSRTFAAEPVRKYDSIGVVAEKVE